MSKSNLFENELLLGLFNNQAIPNIGDVGGIRASVTTGSLYVALHTADPGEAGNQSTSEATYTGYARVAVARTVGGFTVSGNQVTNAADITFGTATAGTPQTVTHWSIGKESSGTTAILYKGTLRVNGVETGLVINVGVAPRFIAGSLQINED